MILVSPSITEKFIKLRLENDHLFQKKFRAWNTFRDILIREGFPENISCRNYSKKWNNLFKDYKDAVSGKIKNWKYMSTFEKYVKKSSSLNRYQNWTTEWIQKLLEIRIENEDVFKSNLKHEESWSLVERKIKEAGLPLECSVRCIDQIWDSHLNKYKSKYLSNNPKSNDEKPWPFYECLKLYFETLNSDTSKTSDEDDSDDDSETSITLKNIRDQSRVDNLESFADNLSSEEDFVWTSDYTESLIHLKFKNENVFKKKHCWDEFHKIMMANGFPKTISAHNARSKWGHIMEGYKRALLLDKRDSIHFNLINSYLENLQPDLLKDWSEEWIKHFINLRTKKNSLFVGSVLDDSKKWGLMELELRKVGLPHDHPLRNIHTMWSALTKEFKFLYKKQKVTSSEITWPYYEQMKKYFQECEPEFFLNKNKSDNNEDSNSPFEEVNLKHHDIKEEDLLVVKREYSGYLCRGCLQSGDQMVSLYESSDNVVLAQKFIECTAIQIEDSSDSPNHLCYPCLSQLNIAYEFRKKCQQTESTIKNQLEKKVKLKIEDINTHDSDYNFEVDIFQTLSDDEEKTGKLKIKKSKVKEKIVSKKVPKKPAVRSKNIVLVPIKSESGEVTYKRKYVYNKFCEICGKSTKAMKQHMATHLEGQNMLVCEICSKTFKYRASYTTHMKTHSETPLKICQLCGKEFFRNLCYRRHMITHANERKFSCETCGKAFNTNDILRIHIRSHTGERPYPCSICGKAFISRGCLSRHMKVHN